MRCDGDDHADPGTGCGDGAKTAASELRAVPGSGRGATRDAAVAAVMLRREYKQRPDGNALDDAAVAVLPGRLCRGADATGNGRAQAAGFPSAELDRRILPGPRPPQQRQAHLVLWLLVLVLVTGVLAVLASS